MAFRSGFVALVGKPNAGKSTLVNLLVGQKVSIVSSKPQTTRRSVLGVVHGEDYEIALIDTPGIHEPHTLLARSMIEQARTALGDADLVLFVADASRKPDANDERIAKLIVGEYPILLCLNKADVLLPEFVLNHVELYCELLKTDEYMLTSALKGYGHDKLLAMMAAKMPEGERRFDEDFFTDQHLRFMAAEIIREQVLTATRQEIPHACAVYVEEWIETQDSVEATAIIQVEKASQRGILIGAKGQFIKKVGMAAREEIAALAGKKVRLDLFVKVEENWRMSPRALQELSEHG